MNSKIIITCAPHTPQYVAQEVEALGFTVRSTHHLDVETEGTLEDCMKLNLYLRTAHRVLWQVHGFQASNADQLYQTVRRLPWEKFIPTDGYFSVNSFVRNNTIRDHRFANLKVKDAIVDRFQSLYDQRPDSGPQSDRIVVFLHWKENEAGIFLDTSGETIARHGYRSVTVEAPMQESLAAAIIQATAWHPGQPFINPMCGSGTLAIEAALISINKAPGLLRDNFGFMHLKTFSAGHWEALRQEATQQMINLEATSPLIIATDQDTRAVEAARANAEAAGVAYLIHFETTDFAQTLVPAYDGQEQKEGPVIVINPPYGERLGEEESLKKLYAEIGDFFKQKGAGYTGYIFTGNLALAKHVGLRTKSRTTFFNAKLECRLLEYELYAGKR